MKNPSYNFLPFFFTLCPIRLLKKGDSRKETEGIGWIRLLQKSKMLEELL
ncbi:hypothetical protein LEP1GSC050_4097 [Leptospira broomii serovar Hurstbridge str. 5399]|uniref:Uncharacterized protein n=1 Tax=Leptospira broomii serovar Hurstbridge str. 5399 TaxID=1049789 RepID=T0F9V0_9LEPT|nr:hypothetical protein LEP1GSC050_4097 [Leptospira broomii serovar Hurstbridge str. 5399]